MFFFFFCPCPTNYMERRAKAICALKPQVSKNFCLQLYIMRYHLFLNSLWFQRKLMKTVKRYGTGEISCCSHFKMRADIQIAICRQLILVYFAHTIENSRSKMVTIHGNSLSCTYWVLSIIVLLLCATHFCTV